MHNPSPPAPSSLFSDREQRTLVSARGPRRQLDSLCAFLQGTSVLPSSVAHLCLAQSLCYGPAVSIFLQRQGVHMVSGRSACQLARLSCQSDHAGKNTASTQAGGILARMSVHGSSLCTLACCMPARHSHAPPSHAPRASAGSGPKCLLDTHYYCFYFQYCMCQFQDGPQLKDPP